MRITNDNHTTYSGINFKNVYLDNGRILTEKKVDRELRRISRSATITKITDSIKSFVRNLFIRNK